MVSNGVSMKDSVGENEHVGSDSVMGRIKSTDTTSPQGISVASNKKNLPLKPNETGDKEKTIREINMSSSLEAEVDSADRKSNPTAPKGPQPDADSVSEKDGIPPNDQGIAPKDPQDHDGNVDSRNETQLVPKTAAESSSVGLTEQQRLLEQSTPSSSQSSSSSSSKAASNDEKDPTTGPAHLQKSETSQSSHGGANVASATRKALRVASSGLNDAPTTEPLQPSDTLQTQRDPLTKRYGPYIHPSDTSLEDARRRLLTALEQTRRLRSAFTHRLFEKYRLTLQPVPPSVDSIVEAIEADPSAKKRQLDNELRWITEEKEAEKVESVKSPNTQDFASPAIGLPDVEEWYGAGLNLVVLPENMDAKTRAVAEDPSLSRISNAASSAADMLLDRVRQASSLRLDKSRRRQLADEGSKLMSSLTASRPQITMPIARTMPVQSKPASRKRPAPGSTLSTGKKLQSSSSSGGKKQVQIAGNSLLSLNPLSSEETTSNQMSAATASLVSLGVGLSNSARAATNRFRAHPFPDSFAGRRATAQTGRRVGVPTLGSAVPGFSHLAEFGSLDLPIVPVGKDRKRLKRVQTEDWSQASEKRATESIQYLLSKFTEVKTSGKEPESDSTMGGAPTTEIGLMLGLRQSSQQARESVSSTQASRAIDPSVTFSVLHSLGLIKETRSTTTTQEVPTSVRIETLGRDLDTLSVGGIDARKPILGVKELRNRASRIQRNKRSFKDAFRRDLSFEKDVGSKDDSNSSEIQCNSKETHSTKSSSNADGSDHTGNGVPVLPLRGGGGAAGVDSDEDQSSETGERRAKMEAMTHDSAKTAVAAEVDSSTRIDGVKSAPNSPPPDTLAPRRATSTSQMNANALYRNSTAAAFSPPRNNVNAASHLGQEAANLIAQRSVAQAMAAERYHAATAPLQLQNSLHSASMIQGMYSAHYAGAHSDWAHLEAASAAAASLSPLGGMPIDAHRAALMGMTTRDHAARAIIAHEAQQRNAAAAVAAAHRASVAVGLPPQAALLMGTQQAPPAAMIHRSVSGPPHFQTLGSQSASTLSLENTTAGLLASRPSSSSSLVQKSLGSQTMKESGGKVLDKSSRTRSLQQANSESESLQVRQSFEPPAKKIKAVTQNPTSGKEKDQKMPPTSTKSEVGTSQTAKSQEQKIPSSEQRKPSSTDGMKFFEPDLPARLERDAAELIKRGLLHEAIQKLSGSDRQELSKIAESQGAILEYLRSLGSAVPIPKALISNPLKERLTASSFKSPLSGCTSLPRDPIVATISVWLWVQHQDVFQKAFSKSGRIDVDPDCKFLIQTAIESACKALLVELTEAVQKGTAVAVALGIGRPKNLSSSKLDETRSLSQTHVELFVAKITSAALMRMVYVDENANITIPVLDDLVEYLDEARLLALRLKCMERSMLIAVVTRAATVSEHMSHAYVGSIVRAGETLGHDKLFELLQDETLGVSSMMPYDIFSDEVGAWEDPCRPLQNGFTPNLYGADLIRRAHSRAMIHKSLRKMQDRNNIRGGTSHAGPYSDPSSSNVNEIRAQHQKLQATQKGPGRRRSSSHSAADATKNPGTGFAPAMKMSLYNPNHQSPPLTMETNSVENSPYGKHLMGPKQRAFSAARLQMERRGCGGKRGRKQTPLMTPTKTEDPPDYVGPPRSTHEVGWADVAEIFKVLGQVEAKTPRSRQREEHRPSPPAPSSTGGTRTIIAPFCRRIPSDMPLEVLNDEEDTESEEDLSDEAILGRHQIVLEDMREKLDKLMASRQNLQSRSRSRSMGNSSRQFFLRFIHCCCWSSLVRTHPLLLFLTVCSIGLSCPQETYWGSIWEGKHMEEIRQAYSLRRQGFFLFAFAEREK